MADVARTDGHGQGGGHDRGFGGHADEALDALRLQSRGGHLAGVLSVRQEAGWCAFALCGTSPTVPDQQRNASSYSQIFPHLIIPVTSFLDVCALCPVTDPGSAPTQPPGRPPSSCKILHWTALSPSDGVWPDCGLVKAWRLCWTSSRRAGFGVLVQI